MKTAIITITEDARKLALKLKENLDGDPTVFSVETFNKNVKKVLSEHIGYFDCIIGIMATGIMVRNICGLIKNKGEDPAVLVMDDQGKYVISLLSGHFGGANGIALKIAQICGAEPVITTATDTHGKIGIDVLARKYHMDIDDFKKIKAINSALIENKVDLFVPPEYEFIFEDPMVRGSYNKRKSLNELKARFNDVSIILKPKKLVVGIGARKGIKTDKVQKAIFEAMKLLDLPLERINAISTAEIKENEAGIIETASNLEVPLEIVKIDEIKRLKNASLSSSVFVYKKFYIPGVCEPAALIAAGENSRLIFKKTSYDGVTIAVAVSSND
ncbi:cobalt-precorrin 5A hydrolase [Methanobacterium sp. ACI-7]|uniref:cobalt-precorrin 5A hydrolase n=1 Tax=unclassified Methanobacterium TaxID=2627676 RepID=UPI0039C32543